MKEFNFKKFLNICYSSHIPMSVWLIEVLDEFSSLLLRWTVPFLLAQISPPVLAGIWMCLGEGRGQWNSKATPLTPQKYTRDGGWPTDWNSSFCSYGGRKRNVAPKRKAKQPHKTMSEPPMHYLNRYSGKCTEMPQAQDLFRCTAQEIRKRRWNILPGKGRPHL